MLLKNVGSQGVYLFAYTIATGVAKTGDSANITGYSSIDGATTGTVFATTNPTEISSANMPGVYWQPLSQSETNGNAIAYMWKSATSGVAVDPVVVLTTGVSLPAVAHSAASGLLTSGTGTGQLSVSSGLVTLAGVTHTGAVIPTVTTTTTATNLTNLPAITTDWLTGTGVAASAVTKIQAGLATPTNITAGTITTVTNLTNLPAITTDWLTGTGVAASAVTKIQAGLATPTNITAGTITTVTNLINAATAGDLTATMKASVTTAATAATPTISSVSGSVGSVTAAITLPTIPTDWITANGIAADAIGASELATGAVTEIAGAVWDVVLASHLAAGSTGAGLNAASSAGDPWATALPGAYGAGSAGNIIGTYLDAAVSTRSTYAGGAVASVTGAVGSVAGNVGGNVVGSVASVTGNVGGNVAGSVGSVSGAVGSVTGNVGGNVVGSVASVAGNVGGNVGGSVASVTAAVTLPTIPTDWIAAAGIASGALNGKGDWNTTTPPSAATIASAVLTTAMPESYNADGAAPTLAQSQFVTMQRLTDFAIAGTTITVRKIDGSTTAYTLTMDSATTPTSATRAT